MNTNDKHTEEREAIEAMLPWYEAGQLEARDAKRVEDYLAGHPDVADQLALIAEERAETVLLNEARGAPKAGALDRLMTEVEAHEEGNPSLASARIALKGWMSKLVGAPVPAAVQWATAAAAVVIVAQGLVLGTLLTSGTGTGPTYETASGPGRQAAQGTFALVQFSGDATAEKISAFLSDKGMAIVDGPKPGGVYKVRISSQALDEAKRDTILEELQAQGTLIVFAAPTE